MKKFKAILISAISALGLASCSFQDVMTAVKDGTTGAFDKVKDVFVKEKDEGEPKTCSHVDEGKDHVCDLCGEAMGEHKDSDGDGKCDYCAQDIPSVGSVKFENAPTTIMVGKTVKLTAVANAVGGASSKVKYSILEGTAATVDSNGNLTGVSPGTVVVKATSIVDSSKFATITVEVVEPNWSAESLQLMEENLGGVVLPYLGTSWSEAELDEDDGLLFFESDTGDLDALKTLLEEAGFSVSKVNFTVDQKGNTAPGLSISKEVEGVGVAEAQLIDYTSYGYGFELYAYFEEFMQWPAEELAEFIGDHTETSIPVPVAKVVDAYEQPESEGYSAYIIDLIGDYQAYLTALQTAGYTGGLTQYGYYDLFSADDLLEVVLFPQSGSFEIQVILAEPPAVEWPTSGVAAFCEGYTEVEIPAAEGEEFYVQSLNPAESNGYFGVIQVIGGTCSEYLTTLQSAGFTVQYDQTNDFYFAIKDNLELDVFEETGYFVIQATVYVDPTIWPAETIAAFLKGHTDVEVPAASGDSYIAQASTGDYYGLAIVYGGVVVDYCSTLQEAGFEVSYDSTYECYTAHKEDLAIDIYEYPTYMGLGFYTYVAPVAEWPTEAIGDLLNGKTEVSIPEAEGTAFVVTSSTGFYFGSITISGGDMETYLLTLESAEFSVIWDSRYECYVAAKDNLLMDIGENPNVEGEFQMLLYLKAAFPTEDVAEAVQLLVPGSETIVPEIEAEEYQLQDARAYIGGFVLYAAGDSSLLNEYTDILDEAGWAVSELEEGIYGAVSPAEDIMLQVFYDDDYGELDIYILTYTKPATEWPADEVAALVKSIEAEGTVPAADGLSFVCYEAEGWYPAQINVEVEAGTSEAAAAAYVAQLKEAGFFLVMSSYGYDYYAEEGNTLALCVYTYSDSEFIIELGCLASPAVKPLTEWPADAVVAIVESIEAEGSTVPAFEGEGISFNIYPTFLTVNPGANDPEDLVAGYREKLEGLGYFVAGDNYGDPIYALDGETLGISPYYYNGSLYIEFMELAEPAVKPVPAEFPKAAVEAFFNGKTDEVVPEMVAYGFKTSDKTSYLEIQAEGGNVKDYMKVLSDAGWTADYDSSAYYNYATSPKGSIKMTLINYTSYVTLKLEYIPPKLTEWPADAIAEALGEKAKTTLPGITGEGLQFEFTDNGDNSMKLDVYGSTPTAYISILEDAGFTVTEGSQEDQYWYLLSADKTVKVQVYDYMSVGQDYFRVKAYGQDPTWTVTSFDASVVEQALGLEAGFIPAIADGTKFSLTQTSDSSIKITVESGANYSNFTTALTGAGFEETSAGSNVFVKENVTAVVSILNPITQKYSVEYTVQSSPAPQGEWPLEQIAALLGDTRAAYLPEAEGATSVIVTGSEGDCTISITGVSAAAYKQALLDAGFYFDGMSYSKNDLYVDVTGSGDSCTVNAYYFDF